MPKMESRKKQLQEIKTNKNISYVESRKLVVPQQSQTYAQVAKSSTISATTETDEKTTKIICPPLQCLKPVSFTNQIPSTSPPMPTDSTSSSSTQTQLLPSTSFVTITLSSESQLPIPLTKTAPAMSNSLSIPATYLPHPQHLKTTFYFPLLIEWKIYQLKSSHLSLCLILHLPHPLVNHLFQRMSIKILNVGKRNRNRILK
ncbi:hypothetical protein TNCV_4626811 [Trichonephila clavipes]|nr:hypothetical protein TNCV_4626811 [Trichonephila clavipes]